MSNTSNKREVLQLQLQHSAASMPHKEWEQSQQRALQATLEITTEEPAAVHIGVAWHQVSSHNIL